MKSDTFAFCFVNYIHLNTGGVYFVTSPASNYLRPAVHACIVVTAVVYTKFVDPYLMHVECFPNRNGEQRKILLKVK